jgi:hypothetical protein
MSRKELPDWIDRGKLNLVYNKQEMVEKYVDGGDSYVLHVRNTLATKGIEMTPKEIKDIADELIMYYYILMDNFEDVEHLLEEWDDPPDNV